MAKCSICNHERVREIDSLLDSHESQKNISLQFPGVSVHALSRHGRRLCKPASSDPLDADEKLWLDRLDKAHKQAVADGDIRGQQQIAATGLRVARQRRTEAAKAKAAKAASDADSEGKISIGDLDSLVQIFSDPSVVADPTDRAKVEYVMRKAHGLMRMDAEQVFQKMWENQRFCNDLIAYASQWKEEPSELVQAQTSAPN